MARRRWPSGHRPGPGDRVCYCWRVWLRAVIGFAALVACSPTAPAPAPPQPQSSPAAVERSAADPRQEDALDAAAPAADPRQAAAPGVPTRAVALVTDPAALAAIAEAGGRFDALLDGADRAAIFETARADIAAAGRGDPNAGVGIAGHTHRLFDAGWLERGAFELIGVAYRVDRIPATPGACGDLRLIYRLGYRARTAGVEVGSRLPMTVAVVLRGPARAAADADVGAAGDALGCRAAAAAWRQPAALAGRALGEASPPGRSPARCAAIGSSRC